MPNGLKCFTGNENSYHVITKCWTGAAVTVLENGHVDPSPPGQHRRYDRNLPGSGKNGTLVDGAESERRLAGQTVGGMVAGWAVLEANVNPDDSEQPERPFAASTGVRVVREDRLIRGAKVNSDGHEEPERPFTASTVARMDREDRSCRRAK